MQIYCSKDYIVTIGNQSPMNPVCYLFERRTGNFVRQISRKGKGQGPGEYAETNDFFWDGDKEQICMWGLNQYLFYNLDGSLSHRTNNFNLKEVPYEIQETGRYELVSLSTGGYVRVDRYEQYVCIVKVFEDNKHLYFTIEYKQQLYPAIYEKTVNELRIISPITIPPRQGRGWKIPLYGFENDLDGGLPFWPQQMISENEMMCVYTAEELLAIDSSKITDEKLKNVLKNLKEDDNPVVAIVTLKE